MVHDDPLVDPLAPLLDEFIARYRRGEEPALEEYTRRHPELAERIQTVFPMTVLMEEAGSSGGISLGATFPGASADTDKAGALPERIGGYRILREVGRGGMGVVYEAEQLALRRHVALKVLAASHASGEVDLERFQREAQAAARLHHTNIVPVFEVGAEGDAPFYAMQFIYGQPLDQVLHELRAVRAMAGVRPSWAQPSAEAADAPTSSSALSQAVAQALLSGTFRKERACGGALDGADALREQPPGEASAGVLPGARAAAHTDSQRFPYYASVARIGIQVAQALAYAHHEGVIHRDIKPSNLLLDTAGRVWITDFGLAKTDASALTQPGDVVGTVRYMAPERFRGWSDPRSDVYSLGLTLYEMLLLRPAFPSPDRLRVIQQVGCVEPAPLRQVDAGIPRDLETIVAKAIDKEPGRRYQTAAELAADLERFLEDKPISARRISGVERAWRWCRRNPWLAGLWAAVVVVAMVGVVAVLGEWQVAVDNAAQAQKKEQEATSKSIEARQLAQKLQAKDDELGRALYAAHMNLAASAWQAGTVGRVLELLEISKPGPGETDQRGFEWHYWQRLCHQELDAVTVPLRAHFPGADTPRQYLHLSADGSRVLQGDLRSSLRSWDTLSRRVVATLPPLPAGYGRVTHVASRDGRRLARMARNDEAARQGRQPRAVLQVFDLEAGVELFPPLPEQGKRTTISTATFSHDGNFIAWVEWGLFREPWTVCVWDLARGRRVFEAPYRPISPSHPLFSPDGKTLALSITEDRPGSDDAGRAAAPLQQFITLLDAVTGREQLRIPTPQHVLRLAFSPDSGKLAARSGMRAINTSGQLKIWDTATGKETLTVASDAGHFQFSPDGKLWAEVQGTSIQCRDATTGQIVQTFKGHTQPIVAVAFVAGGRHLRSLSIEGTVKTWDLTAARPKLLHSFAKQLGMGMSSRALVATNADGSIITLAPVTRSDDIIQYDRSGRELSRIKLLPNHAKKFLALSPDSRLLLAWSDAPSGPGAGPGTMNDMGLVRVIETATGKERFQVPVVVPTDHSCATAWTEDSKHFAVCVRKGTAFTELRKTTAVKIFDSATGHELAALNLALGSAGALESLALTADGTLLIGSVARSPAYGGSGRVFLWDGRSGEQKLALTGAVGFADLLALSGDGRRLACGDVQYKPATVSEVSVFDIAAGRKLFTLKGLTGMLKSLSFVPGNRLLTVSQERAFTHRLKLWDAEQGRELLTLDRTGGLLACRLTTDNRLITIIETDDGIYHEVLDARSLTPEVEARTRVSALVRATPSQAEIVARLQADIRIEEPVRRAALKLAAQLHDDALNLNQASWRIVIGREWPAEDYRRALRYAEAACRLDPVNGSYLRTLGAAQYRVGMYPEALATLIRAEKANAAQQRDTLPLDLAFLAMTCKKMGHPEQARQYRERLRALRKPTRTATDGPVWSLLEEAEALAKD